nr:immunoglobulin light chain junction region [Homo sapiens]MCC69021.1 immunoglobulin light chain junction region [Homo sapiens]
EPEDFAVYYCQ